MRAENTDAEGFLRSLAGSPQGKRALVLGAGGAARAVVWALLREGAEVEVWNRTELRSQHLCEELGGETVDAPDQVAYELIVNTTAVGLGGEDPFAELPLEAAALRARVRPWSTWSTAVSPPPCSAPPMRPAPPRSTASRSSSSRVPSRSKPGPTRPAPLDTMRVAARA